MITDTSSRRWVTDYGGCYGCRGGATNGLVSNARLFFVRQLSSLSSAARLWSRGIRIVDPAPSIIKALAARSPSINFLSEMGTKTELASAATSVFHSEHLPSYGRDNSFPGPISLRFISASTRSVPACPLFFVAQAEFMHCSRFEGTAGKDDQVSRRYLCLGRRDIGAGHVACPAPSACGYRYTSPRRLRSL